MNDVVQRVSGESQPVPLWRTASTEDLDTVKEQEVPLLYSFRLNLKVITLEGLRIIILLNPLSHFSNMIVLQIFCIIFYELMPFCFSYNFYK